MTGSSGASSTPRSCDSSLTSVNTGSSAFTDDDVCECDGCGSLHRVRHGRALTRPFTSCLQRVLETWIPRQARAWGVKCRADRHAPRKRGIQYAEVLRSSLTSVNTGSSAFADDDGCKRRTAFRRNPSAAGECTIVGGGLCSAPCAVGGCSCSFSPLDTSS